MAQVLMESKDLQTSRLAAVARAQPAGGPSWLQAQRRQAAARFEELGFPTRKEEAWRFTNIQAIAAAPLVWPAADAELTANELAALRFTDFDCPRMVFVNGVQVPGLSRGLETLPPGLRVRSLAEAWDDEPEHVRELLGSLVDSADEPFHALNLAFLSDGALVEVAQGAVIRQPLALVFLTLNRGEEPILVAPRVVISAAENAQLTVIESHCGVGTGSYLSNSVTEILAADAAVVDHYQLQQENPKAFHVATVQSNQGRRSNLRTTTATLTGQVVRNQVNVKLDGEGGWAELDGLFLVGDDHHVDNFTRIDHAKPHCDSREVYKGILTDQGRGVFRGRIVVAEGAQKTDSKQTNNNLLLSDDALINTKPQLEIYADDVKCTHGATVGQLEEDALFYLQARGISKTAARSMLIYAFASEVVGRIKVEALRAQLDAYLSDWLPAGDVI